MTADHKKKLLWGSKKAEVEQVPSQPYPGMKRKRSELLEILECPALGIGDLTISRS